MWGTSSPDGTLACDLGNVFEGTRIGGRQSDRLSAGKLSSGNFGLLQQYLPLAVMCSAAKVSCSRLTSPRREHSFAVLFVANLFQPIDVFPVQRFLNCSVG